MELRIQCSAETMAAADRYLKTQTNSNICIRAATSRLIRSTHHTWLAKIKVFLANYPNEIYLLIRIMEVVSEFVKIWKAQWQEKHRANLHNMLNKLTGTSFIIGIKLKTKQQKLHLANFAQSKGKLN